VKESEAFAAEVVKLGSVKAVVANADFGEHKTRLLLETDKS
jgi:hypothetical protein